MHLGDALWVPLLLTLSWVDRALMKTLTALGHLLGACLSIALIPFVGAFFLIASLIAVFRGTSPREIWRLARARTKAVRGEYELEQAFRHLARAGELLEGASPGEEAAEVFADSSDDEDDPDDEEEDDEDRASFSFRLRRTEAEVLRPLTSPQRKKKRGLHRP